MTYIQACVSSIPSSATKAPSKADGACSTRLRKLFWRQATMSLSVSRVGPEPLSRKDAGVVEARGVKLPTALLGVGVPPPGTATKYNFSKSSARSSWYTRRAAKYLARVCPWCKRLSCNSGSSSQISIRASLWRAVGTPSSSPEFTILKSLVCTSASSARQNPIDDSRTMTCRTGAAITLELTSCSRTSITLFFVTSSGKLRPDSFVRNFFLPLPLDRFASAIFAGPSSSSESTAQFVLFSSSAT
mmetsp:Transcript_130593/g.309815  ORF Transcript_130593/g.309815 Transcript_130593/m.309815 type:complete len:245 (+) Transcript_130593:714-1448(+)